MGSYLDALDRQHLKTRLAELLQIWGASAKMGRSPLYIWLPSLLVAGLILLSPMYLVFRSLNTDISIWQLLIRPRIFMVLLRTILLVVSVTVISSLIAIPLAWLQVRTDLRLKKLWSVLTLLPLVIPSYVGGFIFIVALGPKGMLQKLLSAIWGIERIPDINGYLGAVVVLSLLSFPYILLTVKSGLRQLDPNLEESAQILGDGRWRLFFLVTMPILRPSIVAGALLVALYTLSDFGAVSILRYETFTWAIFNQYEGSLNRNFGALLSMILIVISLFVVVSEGLSRGKGRYYRSGHGVSRHPKLISLGHWQWPSLLFSIAVTVLGLALPISVLLYWLTRGVLAGEPLLILLGPMINSITISLAAAVVTVIVAIPVAVLSVRYISVLGIVIEKVTYIGFALPGIAVALGLVFFGANYMPLIYQTFVILIVGYVILFLPAAVGSIRASLLQVRPEIEQAGRSLGHSSFYVLKTLTIPLVKHGMFAGGAIVFLLTMKELPATLILSPLGFDTLATSIWSASSEAFFAQAAAPALLLILVSAIPLALITIREDFRS